MAQSLSYLYLHELALKQKENRIGKANHNIVFDEGMHS